MRPVILVVGLFVAIGVAAMVVAMPSGMATNLRHAAVILWNGPRHPPTQSLVYKETASRPLALHFFAPDPSAPTEPSRATVVLFHGGGFHSGWPEELFPLASRLAGAGHAVFVPEYRLQRSDGADYAQELTDCRDAVAWVEGEAAGFGADPTRLVLGGSSAGAHLAASLVALPPAEGGTSADPLGLILSAPYLDSAEASERFEAREPPEGWLQRRFAGPSVDVFGGRSRDFSPRAHLHAEMPPVRIMAGAEDRLWPPALEFCEALRALGADCAAKSYPGAGHGFALIGYEHHEAFVSDVLAAIEDWLLEAGERDVPVSASRRPGSQGD